MPEQPALAVKENRIALLVIAGGLAGAAVGITATYTIGWSILASVIGMVIGAVVAEVSYRPPVASGDVAICPQCRSANPVEADYCQFCGGPE